jgi:antitoxin (DNA-binding transcriptional repressor) of toxin-antitoxin stability system
MQTTMSADQARINWRDTVDLAFRGGEVVIERYNKPVAVVVNYDEWQARRFTSKEVEAIVTAYRKRAEGQPTISHEELTTMIAERAHVADKV